MRACRVSQQPPHSLKPLDKIEEQGSEMISEELAGGNSVIHCKWMCFVVFNESIQDWFYRAKGYWPWRIWSNYVVHTSIGRNEIRCRAWQRIVLQIKEIKLEDSMKEYQKILREVKLLALLKTNYTVRYYSVVKWDEMNRSAGSNGMNVWKRWIWVIRIRTRSKMRKIRSMRRRWHGERNRFDWVKCEMRE